MLDFIRESIVLAGEVWFGTLIIATISITVMVLVSVLVGVIKITISKDDD